MPADLLSLAELRPAVIMGGIDNQVDVRLSNQAEIIGRMNQHITYHHGELHQDLAEQCTWYKSRGGKF